MSERTKQQEVDDNFEAFQRRLPELLETHKGKFALMRNGEMIQFFDSARDALIYGEKQYPDGLFSIQEVTTAVADLGFFSHALHHASV